MRTTKIMSLAVLGALALSPAAFAQDAGTGTTSKTEVRRHYYKRLIRGLTLGV